MCTRGKLSWLGRSVACSKSIFQPNYHYATRPYAALGFKKNDSPVQNRMNTRTYSKGAPKQSTSVITGLKGTATALVNQIHSVFEMWGLLGQLMRQPRKPDSLELCLEEQHWSKEIEKSKQEEAEALRAEEDRKRKICEDALLLSKGSNKDLEACCKKLAEDKKKEEAAKKKRAALEKCCKKLADDKKKEAELKKKCQQMEAEKKKKEEEKKKKELQAQCKKMEEEKKKKEEEKKKKELQAQCKKMAEETKKKDC